MSLHYIYSDSPNSTIDITDRCRVSQLSVKDHAEEGAVAISALIIDDPDGDIEFTGHRRLYIYEDTAPANDQIVFNGFTVNERVARGPNRTGAGRQWTVDLADVNVLINRRIMNGADAARNEENDTARILALLTMTELNTVDDDSLVSLTAATVPMDKVDYRGQNVGAYIDDCRQQSGKNAYIYYNEVLGEYGLWYDFASSEAYDSGCFLTTDEAQEVDFDTVFGYSVERTAMTRDPSRVASGIFVDHDGGTVYVQDQDTTDEFAAIDWAAPSENLKTAAKATARAMRYLRDAATEHEVIHTVLTKVPRDKVNKIKKGQLVQFKGEWVPGFTSYARCRVLYRTVIEVSEDPIASFEIEMDLDPQPEVCPSATATGSFYPLGGSGNDPNPSGGNVHYMRAGLQEVYTVTPGAQGSWHFPQYGAGGVGTTDYAGDCTGNTIRLIVVGDGTMTVHTAEFGGTDKTLQASLYHRSGVQHILDSSVTFAAGDDITVDVSTHGQEFCTHYLSIADVGPGCGSKFGFSGFDWVAQ